MTKNILWLSEIESYDLNAGKKALRLAEVFHLQLPVPDGFVLTSDLLENFLSHDHLGEQILLLIRGIDQSNPLRLDEATKIIKKLITEAEIPEELHAEIQDNLTKLQKKSKTNLVLVRPSRQDEVFTTNTISFARNLSELEKIIKIEWAEFFNTKGLQYILGHKQKFPLDGILVQEVIPAVASGKISNIDRKLYLSVFWGLDDFGQSYDIFELSRSDNKIIFSKKSPQKTMRIVSAGNISVQNVDRTKNLQDKLTGDQIKKLINYLSKVESHFFLPQEIHFAFDGKNIYITNVSPNLIVNITENKDSKVPSEPVSKFPGLKNPPPQILKGVTIHPGIKTAPVKIYINSQNTKITRGTIVILRKITPAHLNQLDKSAGGLIVEEKIPKSILPDLRNLGLPVISEVKNASNIFRDGQTVTLNTSLGEIHY